MSAETHFQNFLSSLDSEAPLPADLKKGSVIESFLEVWQELDRVLTQAEKLRSQAILAVALEIGMQRESHEFDVMVHPDWLLNRSPDQRDKVSEFMEKARELKDRDLIFLTMSRGAEHRADLRKEFNFRSDRSVVTSFKQHFDTFATTGYMPIEGVERFFGITKGLHPNDRYRVHGGDWNLCQTDAAVQLTTLYLGKFLPVEEHGKYRAYTDILAAAAHPDQIPVRLGCSFDHSEMSPYPGLGFTAITRKFHDQFTQVIV